jgi:predicted DNA-binding ribbon-helix-helix protein
MASAVIKRSVTIAGHKTSVTLEDMFWSALREIASSRRDTVGNLIDEIASARRGANLSSHIRLFVLDYYRSHWIIPRFALMARTKAGHHPRQSSAS